MGIERNDRKPKRRRTTAQRMKGRRKPVFELPAEVGAVVETPKKAPAKKPTKKKAAPAE
jgi:hypothetical protein